MHFAWIFLRSVTHGGLGQRDAKCMVGPNSRLFPQSPRSGGASRTFHEFRQISRRDRRRDNIHVHISFSSSFSLLMCPRTTDTSFVENPPASSKATPKFSTPAPASRIGGANRGGAAPAGRGGAGRGGLRGNRGSGLARAAKPRGAK